MGPCYKEETLSKDLLNLPSRLWELLGGPRVALNPWSRVEERTGNSVLTLRSQLSPAQLRPVRVFR